jgi:hypothetical protein
VSVRPEFGPTLPALLEARGVSRRAMLIGAVVLVAVALAGWFGLQAARDREQLVVAGPPAINLVFKPSVLHAAPARDGELARIEGRRRNVTAEITVRPVALPPLPGGGDVVGGYLPVLAERRIGELRGLYGPVGIVDEGKARINRNPGYQIGFAARTAGGKLLGRDAYVFPDEEGAREGVLLSLRRVVRRRQTAADEEFFKAVKEAFSSFAFGESQP